MLAMPISRSLPMLRAALRSQEEDKLFIRWAAMYQAEMSFEDFKKRLKPQQVKTAEECLHIAKSILDEMNKGGRGKHGEPV